MPAICLLICTVNLSPSIVYQKEVYWRRYINGVLCSLASSCIWPMEDTEERSEVRRKELEGFILSLPPHFPPFQFALTCLPPPPKRQSLYLEAFSTELLSPVPVTTSAPCLLRPEWYWLPTITNPQYHFILYGFLKPHLHFYKQSLIKSSSK